MEFFELAYLDVEVAAARGRHQIVVSLKNFVIPNPELVPEEVRDVIRKWAGRQRPCQTPAP